MLTDWAKARSWAAVRMVQGLLAEPLPPAKIRTREPRGAFLADTLRTRTTLFLAFFPATFFSAFSAPLLTMPTLSSDAEAVKGASTTPPARKDRHRATLRSFWAHDT